ncbi:hypothetical protein L9F63_005978 [Diploptera punctata]|uniref:Autophagy-related protein 101 n=1 Tax=Diploptera punctata TaxID=6984 RepID=A0AAD7ZBW3_DIPPU|nr:hypothetical protein L9F63_005978 [Diploptera punctata]
MQRTTFRDNSEESMFNMNAKKYEFRFKVECHNVIEVVSCVFHTILFLRSKGKFLRTKNGYQESAQHFKEVNMEFVDLTYVCIPSVELDNSINESITKFSKELHDCNEPKTGKISLEFYRIDKHAVPFLSRHVVWEVWTVHIEVVDLMSVRTIMLNNMNLNEQLTDAIFNINENVNLGNNYVPQFSSQEVDHVFNTNFCNFQTYLFNISHQTKLFSTSLGKTARRLFDELH